MCWHKLAGPYTFILKATLKIKYKCNRKNDQIFFSLQSSLQSVVQTQTGATVALSRQQWALAISRGVKIGNFRLEINKNVVLLNLQLNIPSHVDIFCILKRVLNK